MKFYRYVNAHDDATIIDADHLDAATDIACRDDVPLDYQFFPHRTIAFTQRDVIIISDYPLPHETLLDIYA